MRRSETRARPTTPSTVFARVYTKLGERTGRKLYEEMVAAATLKPRITAAAVGAYAMALVIHGVTVAILAAGIWMLVTQTPFIGAFVAGGVLLLLAYELRPQLGRAPEPIVKRAEVPSLYTLVDEVARAVGAPRVEGIVITSEMNSGVMRSGIRRRPYLRLGLPLLQALAPQERVALLGHEMGHLVNHDPRRGFIVGSAMRTMVSWAYLFTPQHQTTLMRRARGVAGIGSGIANAVSELFMFVARAIASVLINLSWHESQRAEYLADHLAGRTAGNTAAATMLTKLGYGIVLQETVARACNNSLSGVDVLPEFRTEIASGPTDVLLTARSDGKAFRLDSTHPPLGYRIAFEEARPQVATLTLSYGDSDAIDRELEPLIPVIGKMLVDNYRNRLYR
jgi:Zn-dependent protease with chaperone function